MLRRNKGCIWNIMLTISSSRFFPRLHVSRYRFKAPVLLSPFNLRAMSSHGGESTLRPEPDKVLKDIANYVHNYKIDSNLAWETARLCLIDTIGCGLEGLRFPECRKLLGPVVEGTIVPNGSSLYSSRDFWTEQVDL